MSRMMDAAQALELYKKLGREFGRKGGRPRTIIHTNDDPRCTCADCRAEKAKVAKKRVKKSQIKEKASQ